MRRLYLQIYATLVGVLVLFALLASVFVWIDRVTSEDVDLLQEVAVVASVAFSSDDGAPASIEARIRRIAERFDADATLFDARGRPVARVGRPVRPPRPGSEHTSHFAHSRRGRGQVVALALDDERWLMIRLKDSGRGSISRPLGAIAALLVAVVLGTLPLVRRLTLRLEALRTQVEAFGQGRLEARVDVVGSDEIAELATAFNSTADRIETLVEDKKRVLAAASHELRTPLARIRVALELLSESPRPELRSRIERDIEELDTLIEELLLASRLDSASHSLAFEPVDVLAVLAEEAAHHELEVEGQPAIVDGDRRLLARMIRNLLENAARHAGGADLACVRAGDDGFWWVEVGDRGPGVAESEREHIFEPFRRSSAQAGAGGAASPRLDGAGARDGGRMRRMEEGGLGLSLVRQVAERHGGCAECTAREGGGTLFRVRLPKPKSAADGQDGS